MMQQCKSIMNVQAGRLMFLLLFVKYACLKASCSVVVSRNNMLTVKQCYENGQRSKLVHVGCYIQKIVLV